MNGDCKQRHRVVIAARSLGRDVGINNQTNGISHAPIAAHRVFLHACRGLPKTLTTAYSGLARAKAGQRTNPSMDCAKR